jgi:hypothetical protein
MGIGKKHFLGVDFRKRTTPIVRTYLFIRKPKSKVVIAIVEYTKGAVRIIAS